MIDSTAASNRTPRALRLALALSLMGAIWYLSDQEQVGPDLGGWGRAATSAVHFTQFGVLFTLWWWALDGRALTAAAIVLAYAGLDEIHQSWVPRRDADPIDFVVDAAGIAVAWLLLSRRGAPRRR